MPDPGGAAFYGPKICVQAKDAIGRTWQMSTIQVDFNLPERFELEYQAADGTRQRPVMIHRALFGSIERFFGVLIEHYAGAFPAWLAPVQVVGIPIRDDHADYLDEFVAQAARSRASGPRSTHSDDRMQKKIRTAQQQKIPFMVIAGDDDVDGGTVSFRYRDGSQRNGVPLDEAVAHVVEVVRSRINVGPSAADRDAARPVPDPGTDGGGVGCPLSERTVGTGDRTGSSGSGRRTGWPTSPARTGPTAATRSRPAARSAWRPALPDGDSLVVARGEHGLRGAQPLPVQPRAPAGLPVPARGRLHRPDRGRDGRAGRVHPARDAGGPRGSAARTASTWA